MKIKNSLNIGGLYIVCIGCKAPEYVYCIWNKFMCIIYTYNQ